MKEILITDKAYRDLVEMTEKMRMDSFSEAIIAAKIEIDTRTAITFDGVET